jgi:hypothetical protein
MRSGQVWSGTNQNEQQNQAEPPANGRAAIGEDEAEKVGEKNGLQPPGRSATETAVQRLEVNESSSYPALLRPVEEEVEFGHLFISLDTAWSVKETALLQLLESPVLPILQPDEGESRINDAENTSLIGWRFGTVISILALGLLASHQLQQSTKRDAVGATSWARYIS